MERLFGLYEKKKIKPIIDSTFAMEDVADAMKKMHERKNIGKLLLCPSQVPRVKDPPVKCFVPTKFFGIPWHFAPKTRDTVQFWQCSLQSFFSCFRWTATTVLSRFQTVRRTTRPPLRRLQAREPSRRASTDEEKTRRNISRGSAEHFSLSAVADHANQHGSVSIFDQRFLFSQHDAALFDCTQEETSTPRHLTMNHCKSLTATFISLFSRGHGSIHWWKKTLYILTLHFTSTFCILWPLFIHLRLLSANFQSIF